MDTKPFIPYFPYFQENFSLTPTGPDLILEFNPQGKGDLNFHKVASFLESFNLPFPPQELKKFCMQGRPQPLNLGPTTPQMFSHQWNFSLSHGEVFLGIRPSLFASCPTREEILEFLKSKNVLANLDLTAIEKFLIQPYPSEEILVAQTKYPQPGTDGHWIFPHFQPEKTSSEDDSGLLIDFHFQNSLISIKAGEIVGFYEPPTPGEMGLSTTGEILNPQPGRPVPLPLLKGVKVINGGKSLEAEISGHLSVSNKAVSIGEFLEIKGSVDIKQGNIIFPGHVSISGDVLDGFKVQADGDIIVKGTIGACEIETGGNLFLNCAWGKGRGKIRAVGDIQARVIKGCEIDCQGDLEVQQEISECQVKARKIKVIGKGGRLVAGHYTVSTHIACKLLGNSSGSQTILEFPQPEWEEPPVLKEKLGTLIKQKSALLFSKLAATGEKNGISENFDSELKGFDEKIKYLRMRLDEMEKKGEPTSLEIKEELFPGVTIRFGNQKEEPRSNRKGNTRFTFLNSKINLIQGEG